MRKTAKESSGYVRMPQLIDFRSCGRSADRWFCGFSGVLSFRILETQQASADDSLPPPQELVGGHAFLVDAEVFSVGQIMFTINDKFFLAVGSAVLVDGQVFPAREIVFAVDDKFLLVVGRVFPVVEIDFDKSLLANGTLPASDHVFPVGESVFAAGDGMFSVESTT